MARFAVVQGTLVENVILADATPTIPGRVVVLLSATQSVSPGDSYDGTQFAPRVLPPDEQRMRDAIRRLTSGRAQLRQIRVQAQAASDAPGPLTLAQLTTQFRQLAGAVATLAQTTMDVELVLAYQQDDGAE